MKLSCEDQKVDIISRLMAYSLEIRSTGASADAYVIRANMIVLIEFPDHCSPITQGERLREKISKHVLGQPRS